MFDVPEDIKGSHEKFRVALLGVLKPIIEKTIYDHHEEWNEVTLNIIFNEGQKRLNRIRDPKEKEIAKILEGFFEIESTYNALKEFPFFLHRFPSKLPSKSKYLELVITGYLNEVYVLSKRLEAYAKKIVRLYKSNPRIANNIDTLNTFIKKIMEYFDGTNLTRGRHVHENRYQDEDLERLAYLEIFIEDKTSLSELINPIFKKALRENKRKWLQYLHLHNDEYGKILELYFALLHIIIFDNKGNFIYPPKLS